MDKHTPGPWHAEQLGAPIDGGGWAIAYREKSGRDKALSYAQNEADARLIAAAPEMLEALKFISDRGHRTGSVPEICLERADAVIAKAGRE